MAAISLYYTQAGSCGSRLVYLLLEYSYWLLFSEALPEISKDSNGKPYFPNHPGIYFSLSHTKTHVLCAISDQPVGADVETIRPVGENVRQRVCSPAETLDFFSLWTLKESYIKLIGRQPGPLREIVFISNGDGEIIPPIGSAVQCYDDIPGCKAAVCSVSGPFPGQIAYVSSEKLHSGISGIYGCNLHG